MELAARHSTLRQPNDKRELMIIHRGDKAFELEHFGDSARRIKNLFGTTVLPVPWTPLEADPESVKADIQQRFPTNEVCLCECAK